MLNKLFKHRPEGTFGQFSRYLFVTEKARLHYTVSKLVTTGIVFMWNFGSRKLLLFRRNGPAIGKT